MLCTITDVRKVLHFYPPRKTVGRGQTDLTYQRPLRILVERNLRTKIVGEPNQRPKYLVSETHVKVSCRALSPRGSLRDVPSDTKRVYCKEFYDRDSEVKWSKEG